jgi:hypothetical protein
MEAVATGIDKWRITSTYKPKPLSPMMARAMAARAESGIVEADASTTVSISGHIEWQGYTGCPYCGNGGIVKCGGCGEMQCQPSGNSFFSCNSCSHSGEISGTISEMDAQKHQTVSPQGRNYQQIGYDRKDNLPRQTPQSLTYKK